MGREKQSTKPHSTFWKFKQAIPNTYYPCRIWSNVRSITVQFGVMKNSACRKCSNQHLIAGQSLLKNAILLKPTVSVDRKTTVGFTGSTDAKVENGLTTICLVSWRRFHNVSEWGLPNLHPQPGKPKLGRFLKWSLGDRVPALEYILDIMMIFFFLILDCQCLSIRAGRYADRMCGLRGDGQQREARAGRQAAGRRRTECLSTCSWNLPCWVKGNDHAERPGAGL